MAARTSPPAKRFFIYCFREGHAVLYVGKGSGRRLRAQEKRFGFAGEILERMDDEERAYERERYWIEKLLPTENKNSGGAGGFSDRNPIPSQFRNSFTLKEWEKCQREGEASLREIEKIGSRRYAAQTLVSMLDERNCETFGVSKVDINRLREVANGPRC